SMIVIARSEATKQSSVASATRIRTCNARLLRRSLRSLLAMTGCHPRLALSGALPLFFSFLLLASPARAQAPVPTVADKADEEQELQELMNVLQQESEVATKTRMNSDYVPGILTVLAGDELEALGFRFVWDSLAMVPGIQPVRGAVGSPSTIVRGIQFP